MPLCDGEGMIRGDEGASFAGHSPGLPLSISKRVVLCSAILHNRPRYKLLFGRKNSLTEKLMFGNAVSNFTDKETEGLPYRH